MLMSDVDETIDMGYQHGGRAGYGLGSFVKSIFKAPKKIFKSVKKIAKSPLGKAAMAYLATAGVAGIGQGQGFKRFMPGTFMENISTLGQAGKNKVTTALDYLKGSPVPKPNLNIAPGNTLTMGADIAEIGAKKASDFTALEARKWKQYVDGLDKVKDVATPFYKNPWLTIPAMSIGAGLYTKANPGETRILEHWTRIEMPKFQSGMTG